MFDKVDSFFEFFYRFEGILYVFIIISMAVSSFRGVKGIFFKWVFR